MTLIDEAPEQTGAQSRRPRIVWVFTGLAIVFLLLGAAGGSLLGKLQDVQKNDNSSFLPGSADSTKVANQQGDFSSIQSIPGFIVFQSPNALSADQRAKIAAEVPILRGVKGVSADEVGAPQYSKSGKVASISVPLIGKKDGKSAKGPDLVNSEKKVIKLAKQHAPAGVSVHSAGAGGILVAFIDAFSGLDGTLIMSAGLVVIIILLFVYRSPVLWFFPLFGAFIALGVSGLVVYPLAKSGTITLNGQSQGILFVLVIGAGTDYALLLISRYREELHEHSSRTKAMIAAWKGAAPPILASGITVILALICLTFAEVNSTSGLGPVCAIGILATVLVMLTLLPVLLVVAGRWIFWPKRPSVDHQTNLLEMHGVWGRFSRALSNRHRTGWIGATILLLIFAAGLLTLKIDGLPQDKGFTNTPEAITGQQIYNDNFNKGAGAPAVILASAGASANVIAAAEQVKGVDKSQVCVATDFSQVARALTPEKLKTDPNAAREVFGPDGCAQKKYQVADHDGKTLINATLTSSYDSDGAYQTIRDLRTALSKVDGADALVGGQSASTLDLQNASRDDNKLIIPLVLIVILIVLGFLLRALVAPVLLMVTVVLSFGAALGVSAFLFNHVFNFANADPGFPLFAFIFLVALGIDYNIFLMTRVREETIEFGTRDGVIRGLAVTGGVITSAGIVLAATFVVLGVLPIVGIAEIGIAVAVGVLLDTIVVRSILVPALSHEIGKKIWWPSKLATGRD